MYIDCHAHLFFNPIHTEAIDEDITGVIPTPNTDFISKTISNAEEKGVSHFVGVISDPNNFPYYQIQLELENIIHIIGISRGNALGDQTHMFSLLEKEIETKIPQGIGEIGLDYEYGFDKSNIHEKNLMKKKQQELFGK